MLLALLLPSRRTHAVQGVNGSAASERAAASPMVETRESTRSNG